MPQQGNFHKRPREVQRERGKAACMAWPRRSALVPPRLSHSCRSASPADLVLEPLSLVADDIVLDRIVGDPHTRPHEVGVTLCGPVLPGEVVVLPCDTPVVVFYAMHGKVLLPSSLLPSLRGSWRIARSRLPAGSLMLRLGHEMLW